MCKPGSQEIVIQEFKILYVYSICIYVLSVYSICESKYLWFADMSNLWIGFFFTTYCAIKLEICKGVFHLKLFYLDTII